MVFMIHIHKTHNHKSQPESTPLTHAYSMRLININRRSAATPVSGPFF